MGAAGRGPSDGGPSPVRDIEVREVGAREIQVSDIEPEPVARPPPRDFRITGAHRIGQGGLKEKARDNIAATRTLRLIEDEGREPGEAETAVLARYSGWGALSNVFQRYPRSDWEDIAREIRQLLTPEEYDSARGLVIQLFRAAPHQQLRVRKGRRVSADFL